MAGSTNFLQFNPGAANQENDSTYAADSQRAGGVINGQIFNDVLANKAFYQWSTFIAALANALANKGYSPNDTSLSALESVLANMVTFADLRTGLTSVASATTMAFNAAGTNGFDVVLGGNVTSSTLSGQQIGQILTFVIVQGSTPFSFSPPSNINEWIAVPVTANTVWVQQFIVRQDGSIWPVSTEVNALLSQLATVESQIGTINGEISTLQSEISPLATPVSAGSILVSNGSSFIARKLTANNVTGSRAFNAVYQNNSAADMEVFGWGLTSGSSVASLAFKIGPTSSVSSIWNMEYTATINAGNAGFNGRVPQGWFYSVDSSGAISSLGGWWEHTYV